MKQKTTKKTQKKPRKHYQRAPEDDWNYGKRRDCNENRRSQPSIVITLWKKCGIIITLFIVHEKLRIVMRGKACNKKAIDQPRSIAIAAMRLHAEAPPTLLFYGAT